MDDTALFSVAQGSAVNGLARVSHMLDVVMTQEKPESLLALQIAPHVFDCEAQMRTVVGFAYRCVMPVIGRDWSLGPAENGLRGQIKTAQDTLSALTVADFAGVIDRRVRHQAGDAKLDQTARDYVVDFAVPNLWFHLTMAYATLRGADLPLGKADFDGLHAYADGFHFV